MAVLTAAAIVVGPLAAMALARAARRATAGTHARRLVAERRWRLPARPRAWCVRRLGNADVALEPEAACELWLGASAAATILGTGIAGGLAAPVALVALGAGPAGLWAARGRATRRFVTALPGALEQVAVAMRSGASASEAIDMIARGDGPIADDLRRVRARADLGLGLADALATWPTERALPSVRAAAGALALASTVGGGRLTLSTGSPSRCGNARVLLPKPRHSQHKRASRRLSSEQALSVTSRSPHSSILRRSTRSRAPHRAGPAWRSG